ncbi:translocon-associated subunit beta [Brachionus plicatilis]|uniref:Translocon-associated protein subunit beta n=1 Tax=Brachionus plicatilis TaxID=10195 RepID=A0A3M7RP02_BRAPC|nr:translocon-associated subunit beta [Brachionus plicatilis]
MKCVIFLICALLANFVYSETVVADELEDAKLLIAKNVLNNYIVEGLNLTIKYTIHNIGSSPALNVKLQDENFPAEYFEYASGFNVAQWGRIPPKSNVDHVVVVSPKLPGMFNLTSAVVTYLPSEKASKVQTGYSTELGEVYIQKLSDYNRRYASQTINWILFIIIASPSILIPYFLWNSSKSKYQKSKKLKKSN